MELAGEATGTVYVDVMVNSGEQSLVWGLFECD